MDGMTTTPNLPAVIAPRAVALRPLAVGDHVRIVSRHDAAVDMGLVGLRGLVAEHNPERIINESGLFPFTALEDFVVALILGGEFRLFSFSRDELEMI